MGENSCIDRCVSKYWQVIDLFSVFDILDCFCVYTLHVLPCVDSVTFPLLTLKVMKTFTHFYDCWRY